MWGAEKPKKPPPPTKKNKKKTRHTFRAPITAGLLPPLCLPSRHAVPGPVPAPPVSARSARPSRAAAPPPLSGPSLLLQVIERHGLPFTTTTMAKGLIDEDHPLSLGVIERACRQHQRRLLRSADLIVGLGYDTIEVEYEAWIGDVPLLQVDIEPVDIAPSVKLVQ